MKNLPNIHPGEVLNEEFLIPMGLSAYRLSKEINIPQTRISQIIKGKRRITADTALRFSKFFGTSARFWLGLQIDFDLEEEMKLKSYEIVKLNRFTSNIEKHLETANKMGWDIDRELLVKVTKDIGPVIYKKDAALVSFSDPKELERIKKNFLIKKLGIKDKSKLNAVMDAVQNEFKGIRRKPRALFYYMLVEKLGLQSYFLK